MADEYSLRKDIDELYDLVYDNESNQFRLVTKDELAESNSNIELNHYTKIEVDDLIRELIKVTAVTPNSSTDIDTYKDSGLYSFFNNTAIASMTSENKAKLPTGLGDKSFYLFVENKNNYIKQTLTKYSDGRTWIRIRNDDNGVKSWGNWRESEIVGHTHTTSDITNFIHQHDYTDLDNISTETVTVTYTDNSTATFNLLKYTPPSGD